MTADADRARLLGELAAISPMPDDDSLVRTPQLSGTYDRVMNELWNVADDSVIEPVLASFGYGFGFDAYELPEELLMSLSRPAVHPSLMRALSNGAPGSRMWAARMLGTIAEPADAPALIRALGDPLPLVRVHVADALGNLQGPDVVAALARAQADPDDEVRRRVSDALIRIGAAP